MMKRRYLQDVLLGVSALMAAGSVTWGALRAAADTYPGTSDGRGPDGSPVNGCFVPDPSTPWGLGPPLWDHLFDYLDTVVGPAAVFDFQWNNPCGSGTDFWLDDRLADNDVYGRRLCRNAGSVAGTCNSNDIFINRTTITQDAPNGDVGAFERKVWCHETGHGLGLGHENGCMVSGPSTANTYSSHHRSHINARF